MNIKVFSTFLKITSATLMLLYVSSCSLDSDDANVPLGKFIVTGTIVEDNEDNTPLSDVRVALGFPYLSTQGDTLIYYVDSLRTEDKGTFSLSITEYPQPQKFKLKIEDINDPKRFDTAIRNIDFINPSFTGGNGSSDAGETVKEMGLIKMSLKTVEGNPDNTKE